jgi:hypothetical protein
MTSLALLLADGNGRGGGDLYIDTCYYRGEELDLSESSKLEVISEYEISDGEVCKLVVPKIVGSWSGDRIVVAGNYGDKGKFIEEDRPLNDAEKRYVENTYTNLGAYKEVKDLNIDGYALANFEDISDDVREAMKFDPYLKSCMREP